MTQVIHLSAELQQAMMDQARRDLPKECCGLLVGFLEGSRIIISEIVAARNLHPDGGADRFELDPQVRFDVMRRLDGTGKHMIGHYHSHPNGRPEPSSHDLAQAHEPDLIWVIIALTKDQAPGLKAYGVETGPDNKAIGFREIPIQSDAQSA